MCIRDSFATRDSVRRHKPPRGRGVTLSNWGLLTRVFPGGSDYPYGYATVNGYGRFKDVVGLDLAGLTARAALGMSVDELGDKTVKSRDLARGELWLLVDYVQAPATTRTPSP